MTLSALDHAPHGQKLHLRETHPKMGGWSTSWCWTLPDAPSFKSHSDLLEALRACCGGSQPVIHGRSHRGHRGAWHFTKCYRALLSHYTLPPRCKLIWLKVQDQSNSIASERLITSALSDLIISAQPWGWKSPVQQKLKGPVGRCGDWDVF